MNRQDFITYIQNPSTLLAEDAAELRVLLVEHPYCTTGQILYAKALHNTGDVGYDAQLKKAASYAPDRKLLYKHLMQERLINVIEQIEKEDEVAAESKDESSDVSSEALAKDGVSSETLAKEDLGTLEQEILRTAISASISLEVEEDAAELRKEKEDVSSENLAKEEDIQVDLKDGKLSFSDWLNPKEKVVSRRERFDDIIDQFISADPRVKPEPAEMFSPENMAKLSLVDDESFVTETLASIYVKQGNYDKARKAYEQLSLKFPEKSSYFARLLKDLDGLEGSKE